MNNGLAAGTVYIRAKQSLGVLLGYLFTSNGQQCGYADPWDGGCRQIGNGWVTTQLVRQSSTDSQDKLTGFVAAYHQGGTRGSGDTDNVVALLSELVEFKNATRGNHGDAQFWIDSMKKLLGHFIDLAAFSGEPITFACINKILQSAPMSLEEVRDKEWQEKSYANRLVDRAVVNKNLTRFQQNDLALALNYLLAVFPRMEERMRSGIMAQTDSLLFPFQRGRLAALCDGKTNLSPEHLFRPERPAIIILDMPIKVVHQSG